jgi:hypothetical protein
MPVPVSARALVQRINRRLHADAMIDHRGIHGQWHILKKTRGGRARRVPKLKQCTTIAAAGANVGLLVGRRR